MKYTGNLAGLSLYLRCVLLYGDSDWGFGCAGQPENLEVDL